ncbi:MAG: RadC family protein [Leptonema sp. (in: bacteria)]
MIEIPIEERPREKFKIKGIAGLSDEDLIALILGTGIKGFNALHISMKIVEILDETKDIPSIEKLLEIPGIGYARALSILAALEFSRRKWKPINRKIQNAKDAFDAIRHYANRKQEYFLSINLNGANEIINIHLITKGTLNKAIIHPREVFALAIEDRANAIIIAHNHPSGYTYPGEDDIHTTQTLIDSGKILKIPIYDHIIFSETNYYSFLENKLILDSI